MSVALLGVVRESEVLGSKSVGNCMNMETLDGMELSESNKRTRT